MEKLGTLAEVEERWSIDDLFDAHEALDVMADLRAEETERVRRESRSRE